MSEHEAMVNQRLSEVAEIYQLKPSVITTWSNMIKTMHCEPHRHYHTLRHLHHLFSLMDSYEQDIYDKNVLTLAILFHDIVYDPKSRDNEVNSMRLFQEFAAEAAQDESGKFSEKVVLLVSEFILATKLHEVDPTRVTPGSHEHSDLMYFLAFDMAILASSPEDYLIYCQRIRKEYIHVEEKAYCTRRAEFLRKCIADEQEEGKSVLHSKLGNDANRQLLINLQWEAENLENGNIP